MQLLQGAVDDSRSSALKQKRCIAESSGIAITIRMYSEKDRSGIIVRYQLSVHKLLDE
jgi:hypothetical protein